MYNIVTRAVSIYDLLMNCPLGQDVAYVTSYLISENLARAVDEQSHNGALWRISAVYY